MTTTLQRAVCVVPVARYVPRTHPVSYVLHVEALVFVRGKRTDSVWAVQNMSTYCLLSAPSGKGVCAVLRTKCRFYQNLLYKVPPYDNAPAAVAAVPLCM